MRTALTLMIALSILTLVPSSTQAAWNDDQEHESRILSDRWNVWLGGFVPDFKTTVAYGSRGVLGTLIRLEDTLGLEEDIQTGRVGAFYRFSNKRAILFDYTRFNRDASRELGREITIGEGDDEVTYAVGAIVDTMLDNDIFTVTYRHSFINNGKTEAGFTAGLSAFMFDLGLKGTGSVDNGTDPPEVREAEAGDSFLLPVPAFGMYINHAFSKKWILRMSAGFLNLDIGDIEGRYLTTSVTVDYIITKHFGLGGGITRQDVDVSNTGDDNPYLIEYRVGGPTLYFSLVF
jgi:hypothetical protein